LAAAGIAITATTRRCGRARAARRGFTTPPPLRHAILSTAAPIDDASWRICVTTAAFLVMSSRRSKEQRQ
jgi:hypothetical protein